MVKSNFRRALAASLIVHAALAIFWWRGPHVSTAAKITVELDYQEAKSPRTPKAKSPAASGRRHSSQKAKGVAGGSLGKFGATTLSAALAGGAPGAGTNLTDYGETGLAEEEWGSHGNLLGEIEHFNQYEKLFAHLQGMLFYPGILGAHELSDSVNTRLVFDENSHCDWSHSHVGGSHPYFRVYTLSLLHRLCDMETIEHLGFTRGQFVDLSFNFEIIGLPEQHPLPDTIQGNVLMFRRTFLRAPLEYHVGPITGIVGVPAVSIDFPWIFEHWDKWVLGKDPLHEFRPAE
jgi:hypothetical protein